MPGIDGLGQAWLPQQIADQARVASQEGSRDGQKVSRGQSEASILANAAEELTFQHGESESKRLAERKASSKTAVESKAMELARKFLDKVPDLGSPDKLKQLIDFVKKQAQLNAQQLKQQLQEKFPDVSQQHTALEFLGEWLEQTGGSLQLQEAVQQAKSELEAERGPEIRAGVNVSSKAAKFAQDGLSTTQELRDFYRGAVLGFEDLGQAYTSIISQFGEGKFEQGAEFLIAGLGNDLQSATPSREPAMLKSVLDNLFSVRMIRQFHKDAKELLKKSANHFGAKFTKKQRKKDREDEKN